MSSKGFRRKDLKHDEFITATGAATQWLMDHRRRIGWALLAAALVVSIVFGVQFAHQRQEQSAAALLASAMDVYRAPVIPPLPEPVATPAAEQGDALAEVDEIAAAETDPQTADAAAQSATADTGDPGSSPTAEGPLVDPPVPVVPPIIGLQFATAEEKFRAALERFEPIVARYGSRPSGRVAAFYVGDCQSELGNTDAAIAAFTQAAEASGTLVSSIALYRLGQLERDLGNADAAVVYFDRLLDDNRSLFPREETLMAKARAHDEAGDQRSALASYQRVVVEFGDSYSAVEARLHVEELSAQLGLDPNVEGD